MLTTRHHLSTSKVKAPVHLKNIDLDDDTFSKLINDNFEVFTRKLRSGASIVY